MTKIDEKFNDFKIMTITELREQITQGVSESLEKGRTEIHCLYGSGPRTKLSDTSK